MQFESSTLNLLLYEGHVWCCYDVLLTLVYAFTGNVLTHIPKQSVTNMHNIMCHPHPVGEEVKMSAFLMAWLYLHQTLNLNLHGKERTREPKLDTLRWSLQVKMCL